MIQISSIFTPIAVLFITILMGIFLGKIRLFGISLNICAILITAILTGFFISKYYSSIADENFMLEINQFSSLGTSIFISVVGISSGITMINNINKKIYKSMIIGSIMVLFGFVITKIISYLDNGAEYSTLIGVFCGAMTSTPALSAACEAENITAEMVTIGYSYAYPIGVLIAVLTSQILCQSSKKEDSNETNSITSTTSKVDLLPLMCICIVAGKVIGCIYIPILDSGIGTSGGTLFVSIVVGLLIGRQHNISESASLNIYRTFGLSLFLAGNGLTCGIKFTSFIDIKLIIYSLVISLATVFFAYITSRIICGAKDDKIAFILAGGLTSTPAVGELIRKTSSNSLPEYSAAYFGALVTIIALMSIAL